jgi:hypothetical protein
MDSNMDQIRMDSLTGVSAAIVAPARGSAAAADLQQLPRTRQDVGLEKTTIRAIAPVSNPNAAPINTPAIDNRGLPLSGERSVRSLTRCAISTLTKI